MTSHRDFVDSDGETWDIWLILPTAAERRGSERRLAEAGVRHDYPGEERRIRRPDRRRSSLHRRLPLEGEFKNGWLCFESAKGAKRRLAPVPENWDVMSTAELIQLHSRAKEVLRCGLR